MQKLEPASVTLNTFNDFTITNEVVRITYGATSGGRTHANASIESNSLRAIADDNNAAVVSSLRNIKFVNFITTSQEYTKFKFIQ